jgi:hypothetical protein
VVQWNLRNATLNPEQKMRLARIRALARFLDDSLPVPGTNYRVGFDGIVGLVPVVGDAISAFLAAYLIREAAQMGVPRRIIVRMGFNLAVDFLGGAVPIAGDAFDLIWKANKKNLKLLENWLAAQGFLDDETFIDISP